MQISGKRRKARSEPVPDLDEIEGVEIIPGPDAPPMVMGYARISTSDQSLSMQLQAMERMGCDEIYQETVSAAGARPQLDKILRRIRKGDTLIIWKLDRLARSLPDLLQKVEHIEKRGARLHSITESLDTSTPAGRLLFHVLGSLGQFERDLIRERTSAGMKAARERGVQIGAKPMFNEKERKEMQKMRDSGMSVRAIAEHFNCSQGTVQNWTARPTQTKPKRK